MTATTLPAAAPRRGLHALSRRRAFLSHLAFSAMVVAAACAAVFFVWYPEPYFDAAGAAHVLAVLIGVDLVVGPLLTLIVFKPGKKGLLFDVCCIALVQVAALVYGITVMYSERPYFAVFAVDRFYLHSYGDVEPEITDEAWIDTQRIGRKPVVGPLLVAAIRPTSNAGMERLLQETVFDGRPDIQHRPEYWDKYATQAAAVVERARPLTALAAARPAAAADIAALAAGSAEAVGFLPLIATNRDMSLVVDRSGLPLTVLDVDPWIEEP